MFRLTRRSESCAQEADTPKRKSAPASGHCCKVYLQPETVFTEEYSTLSISFCPQSCILQYWHNPNIEGVTRGASINHQTCWMALSATFRPTDGEDKAEGEQQGEEPESGSAASASAACRKWAAWLCWRCRGAGCRLAWRRSCLLLNQSECWLDQSVVGCVTCGLCHREIQLLFFLI